MHKSSDLYTPALLIGVGGTGVKVLRFIQSLAEDIEPEINNMLGCKYIRMVGLDTDAKSNARVEGIDPNMVNHTCSDRLITERVPDRLRCIKETWIHLDRNALNRAIPSLHQNQSTKNATSDDDIPLKTIAKWFPPKRPNGDQITLGHSKLSGAAQWRPLGRLSLFLNAGRVYNAIARAYQDVQQASPSQGPVNAYIVCSLAGGTGGGIFWDLAFFLQMIAPNTKTTGLFLLGDPFESVDEAGRIYPNVYGALKEIYYFKNWKRPYKVTYPIGDGKTFDSEKSGLLPLDTVYLFQAFPPGFGVADRPKATIDYTCFRIAHNLLSHMNKRIHGALDIGANNIGSDATAMTTQKEIGFCFSTSASISFPLHKLDVIAPFFKYCLANLASQPGTQLIPDLPEIQSLTLFPKLDEYDGENRLAPFDEFHENFFAKYSGLLKPLTKLKENVDTVKLHFHKQPDNQPKEISIEALGMTLREALENAIREIIVDSTQDKAKEELMSIEISEIWGGPSEEIEEEINDFFEQQLLIVSQIGENTILSKDNYDKLEEWYKSFKPEQLDERFKPKKLELKKLTILPRLAKLRKNGTPEDRFHWKHLFGKRLTNQIKTSNNSIIKNLLDEIGNSLNEHQYSPNNFQLTYIIKNKWNNRLPSFQESLCESISTEKAKIDKYNRQLPNIESAKSKLKDYLENLKTKLEQEDLKQGPNTLQPPANIMLFMQQMIPSNEFSNEGISEWYQERARLLWHRIATEFKFSDGQLNDIKLVETDLIENLKEIAELLSKGAKKQAGQIPYQPFVHILFNYLIKRDYTSSHDVDYLPNTIEKIVDCIVGYWTAHANNIMMQSGGNDSFRERLWRGRPSTFSNGVIENTLNKKHLVIFPFTGYMEEKEKENFKEHFSRFSQEIFELDPTLEAEATELPIIYYEDLFRSADEITKIHDYYNAYANDHRSRKAFFHIHPEVADWPEIIFLPPQHHAFCGNTGCRYNIRGLCRSERICPECHRPIWNRCGNSDCIADNIVELIEKGSDRSAGCPRTTYIPNHCPDCNGQLHNWWWSCPDKNHLTLNPADKISCVTCLREYHNGERAAEHIHRRPDKRNTSCHGCRSKNPDCCPVEIPAALMPFYLRGVNGNDENGSRLFHQLLARYDKTGLGEHLCLKGRRRHFLFPTCPKGQDRPKGCHHLYRNDDGVWACTDHAKLSFTACGECEYPIASDAPQGSPCPRCLQPVRSCRYCGPITGQRYAPLPDSEPLRCSHCKNLVEGLSSELLFPDVAAQLDYPAFCPNTLGCPAGAEPWRTASEFDLVTCQACEAAHHIPRPQLDASVTRCPLCLILIGRAVGLREKHYTYDKVGELLRDNEEALRNDEKRRGRNGDNHKLDFETRCLICGTIPLQILIWIHQQLVKDAEGGEGTDCEGDKGLDAQENQKTPEDHATTGEAAETAESGQSTHDKGDEPEDEQKTAESKAKPDDKGKDDGQGFIDQVLERYENCKADYSESLPTSPQLIQALHIFKAMQLHRDPRETFRYLQEKTGKTLELLKQDYLEQLALLFEQGSRQQKTVQKRIFELLNQQEKMQSKVTGEPAAPPP